MFGVAMQRIVITQIKFTSVLTLITGLFFSSANHADASSTETNRWTNSASGNWESSGWSLGILPALNQSIDITNAGWKAVAIGTNAALSFPNSLSIASLTVASPTNSFNELLMNYAGLQTPLAVGNSGTLDGSLILGGNAAIWVASSALAVNNGVYMGTNETGAFSVGGTFIESDNASVSAGFIHIGDVGAANFDLTNSTLTVQNFEYLGGAFPAIFNQQGGSNSTGSLVLQAGGEYDLYSGTFDGGVEFQGGNFNQWGGSVTANLEYQFWLGNYRLAAGTLFSGNLAIPGIPPENLPKAADGLLLQTGGTNFAGTVQLGNNYGTGSYVLSNGVLNATGLEIGYFATPQGSIDGCTFTQSGGVNTNGGVEIYGSYGQNFMVTRSVYALNGGTLATPSIDLTMGAVAQSGGTNSVGALWLNDVSAYQLSGGLLWAQSIAVTGGTFFGQTGGFTQTGGSAMTGDLSLANTAVYTENEGSLSVGTIEITGSVFHHFGGSAAFTGALTLANGTWDERTSGQDFAQLQLNEGSNSIIEMPATASVIQFADSSAATWATNGILTIENWTGSITGNGQQQVRFGTTGSALTAQQLGQIQFVNPAGFAAGKYSARILSTGEIVPVSNSPTMAVSFNSTSGAQLTLQGKIGQSYMIQASEDLTHWTDLTSQVNTTGTMTINDPGALNHIARFYRAVVQ